MLKKSTQTWHIVLMYGCLFLVSVASLMVMDKGELVITLNAQHGIIQDTALKYITHLGDGLVFLPALLLAIWDKRRKFTYRILFIFLLHAAVLILFKQGFFPGAPRPIAYLDNPEVLHYVEGVEVHSRRSFPSGHTASAFALAVTLAFMYRSNWVLIVSCVVAMVVGISRMYLLQHFYVDVIVGALIGFTSAFTICILPFNRTHAVLETFFARMGLMIRGLFVRPNPEDTRSSSQTDPYRNIAR